VCRLVDENQVDLGACPTTNAAINSLAAGVHVTVAAVSKTAFMRVAGIANFTTREWLAAPKIAYHLSDTMTAYVGAEVLTGPRDTLFGLVDRTLSAGYAELRSTF